jgi:microsomal dipeptidase-like Zn-dependent dipeptidase
MATLDWKRIHQEAEIVDLHIHPSMQQQLFKRNLNIRYMINRTLHGNPAVVRASFPRLHEGGYDAIFSTVYLPELGILHDFPIVRFFRFLRPDIWNRFVTSHPFESTIKIMDDMESAVASSSPPALMKMAGSTAELNAILGQPKGQRPIAVIHAVEGAHSLGFGKDQEEMILQHLETLYQRGVVCLTLAHFYPNQVVHPCYPFPEGIARLAHNPALWRDLTHGLTDIGKHVVEKMIELGMLIDLSHSTPTARQEIYAIVDASHKHVPLIASHVGAYSINPTPYNLTDWEIRRIGKHGGVIGVIFMPYWLMPKESGQGLNFISRHMQYLIEKGGEDAVGIGSDFDGFTTPPDDLDNASLLPRLTQRLVVDGHREATIKKILGGNALRAIQKGWGKHS